MMDEAPADVGPDQRAWSARAGCTTLQSCNRHNVMFQEYAGSHVTNAS